MIYDTYKTFGTPPDLDPPLADLFLPGILPGIWQDSRVFPKSGCLPGLARRHSPAISSRYSLNSHCPRIPPMDLKLLLTVFATVFIAELGDKTQLATLLFAADQEVSKMTVFIGASLALVLTSALGVLAGGLVADFIQPRYLSYVAGAGFILIGIWTLWAA